MRTFVATIIVTFTIADFAGAAEVATPNLALPMPAPPRSQPPLPQQPDNSMAYMQQAPMGLSLLQTLMRQFGGKPIPDDEEAEQMRLEYDDGRLDGSVKYDGFKEAQGSSTFGQTAKECGEQKQKEHQPARYGGRTMCATAVAEMIQCMGKVIGAKPGCTGVCGHGKNFVSCSNGQMETCGYVKLSPTDSRCNMSGAVLGYATAPGERGMEFGHVNFVCGNNRFCSVFKEPMDRPYPRYPADSCWYPSSAVGNRRDEI